MPTTGVRAANPIWFFNDLVGQPLNDQFYISFLTNTFPYLPQPVFEDVNLTIPWSNPLEFGPNGGLPDNIYWPLDLVWRLEIRQGPTQSDPLIYEINNFSPTGTSGPIPPIPEGVFLQENQITNPQFSEINFSSPVTYTVAGTYPIAPGWNLVITGGGPASTTVSQIVLSGSQGVLDNPPFALKINSSGWTTVFLEQTFNNNGAIWAGGAIAGSILAKAEISSQPITMNYVPSDAGTPQTIFTATFGTGNFIFEGGAIDVLPFPSTNTDPSTSAFVKIQIVLPPTGIVDISNIQITGQTDPLTNPSDPANLPAFQQETQERELDHKFHYFYPQLKYKPIPSHLVGWDFPLNPRQFFGDTIAAPAIGANKSYYAWDQTIIFQSANSGIGVSSGQVNELKLTAAVNSQAAIIQYLPRIKAVEILDDKIACNVSAVAMTASSLGIKTTISLWYTKDMSLPSTVGSFNSIVATLDANGKPATFNGNWIEIPRDIKQDATFTVLASSSDNINDYNFNGWNIKGIADIENATFFAIVIGTETIVAADQLLVLSVGLCSGDIATRPSPQTQDEVLRECQYYWEQSYPLKTVIGTVTVQGAKYQDTTLLRTGGGASDLYLGTIDLEYQQEKNILPTLQFYSILTGTLNRVTVGILQDGTYKAVGGGNPNPSDYDVTASWTPFYIQTDRAIYFPKDSHSLQIETIGGNAKNGDQGSIIYQYSADARLGQ